MSINSSQVLSILIERAQLAIDHHQWKRAIKLLLKAEAIDSRSIDVHFHMALAYLGSNSLDIAELHGRKVLRINPREPNAHLNLGAIKEKQGNLKEAIRYYNLELKICPLCMEAHFNLGVIFFERRRWTSALRHLKQCFDANYNGKKLLYMTGFSAWITGQVSTELLVYHKALEVNKNDTWAMNNLAAVLIDQRNLPLARKWLKKAIKLSPNDPILRRNLARTMESENAGSKSCASQ